MGKRGAWVFIIFFWFINFGLQFWTGIIRQALQGGSAPKPGRIGLFLMALVSYKILRYESKQQNIANKISISEEDRLPVKEAQQAEFASENTFNSDDKVINLPDSEQRQDREFKPVQNNRNFLLLKKAAVICILVGIALPLLGLAFVSNYEPSGDLIWNMQNMEIQLLFDRERGVPKRLYDMVKHDYKAGDSAEDIVRKLATSQNYPYIAKKTQNLIKQGYSSHEILQMFADAEVQTPMSISYKYVFSFAVILIFMGAGLIIFLKIK